MKAILLCAGYGTRLRPLTYKTPKCLMQLNGKPLLEYWLNKLERTNCEEVIVNTHYLANQVEKFIAGYKSNNLKIKLSHEKILLGTAGTLRKHIDTFKNKTGLLIHADNVMEDELISLISAHNNRPKNCLITMQTFKTKHPKSCGIVTLDKNSVVTSFHEKVENPPGCIANGAIYVFDKEFIDFFNNLNPFVNDFSTEILPNLLGKIYTCHTKKNYMDIGTPENLNEAQRIWADLQK